MRSNFSRKKVIVTKKKRILLKGWRDPINGLWRVTLIKEEKDTTSNNSYDILSRKNDDNEQNNDKD